MLTHSELCQIVAERSITPPQAAWFALYEYQSWATQEFPDVLAYYPERTTLYEIKISHSDFLADLKKPARELRGAYRMYSGIYDHYVSTEKSLRRGKEAWVPGTKYMIELGYARFNFAISQEKTFQQAPHLGKYRYYVCEPGVIAEEEVPKGWGLMYAAVNPRNHAWKLTTILLSGAFKVNMKDEAAIFAHALRRLGNHDETGIMIHKWGTK